MSRVIFVFGSNLAGIHGAGAALHAQREKGAEYGVGEGPTGSCYALPTKDSKIRKRTLNAVRNSVNKFLAYARAHPDDLFQITAVGCGLAGFVARDIAPLFSGAPDNCQFPIDFEPYLPSNRPFLEMHEYE